MKKKILTLFVGLSLFSIWLSGCGNNPEKRGKVIATINNEPIFVKEFNAALALTRKRDPLYKVTPQTLKEHVDLLIDKRLLIQEAKKLDLDQADRFINTIQTFWEQTLIRDLVAKKHKEFDKTVSVTDDEIRDYYNNMAYRITYKVVRNDDRSVIDYIARGDPEGIAWDREVGPIGFDDALSEISLAAFSVPEKSTKIVTAKDTTYLIYVSKKERVPIAPFEELKDHIVRNIKDRKKRAYFDSWFRAIRTSSDVRINNDVLKSYRKNRS